MNPLSKLINWYFTKNALPYWCLFLIDLGIVMVSALFTFWIFNRTGVLFEERFDVLYTALAYTLLSAVGAKLFSTYSGVVRYSSFVDLMRVAYANALSLILALILSWVAEDYGVRELSALNQTQTFVTFILAVIVMWGVRVMVKTLYDVTASDKRAMRVLIYGALSGGIGLAKNIRSQNPKRFLLRGFISHDPRAKHIQLMGEKVYNINDRLKEVIEKEGIEAVLVSPLRTKEFRNNQAIQDLLIGPLGITL